jgi:hypothetical protein
MLVVYRLYQVHFSWYDVSMEVPEKRSRAKRGDRTEALLTALAQQFPAVVGRDDFLGTFTGPERTGAAKTLGVLISGTKRRKDEKRTRPPVGEALYLRGGDERVGLHNRGLVSLTVNLTQLSATWRTWDEWQRESRKHQRDWNAWKDGKGEEPEHLKKPEGLSEHEPTQEWIVNNILKAHNEWVRNYLENEPERKARRTRRDPYNRCPVVILDASIIHGNSAFDILITVLYRDNNQFLQYIREVIQRAPCIAGTHTMSIAWRTGFPETDRKADDPADFRERKTTI